MNSRRTAAKGRDIRPAFRKALGHAAKALPKPHRPTAATVQVLVALADFGDWNGSNCRPSIATLCDETGRGHDAVERALAWGRTYGFLVQIKRGGKNTGASRYQAVIAAPDTLQAAMAAVEAKRTAAATATPASPFSIPEKQGLTTVEKGVDSNSQSLKNRDCVVGSIPEKQGQPSNQVGSAAPSGQAAVPTSLRSAASPAVPGPPLPVSSLTFTDHEMTREELLAAVSAEALPTPLDDDGGVGECVLCGSQVALVTVPPPLKGMDLVMDSGCYHNNGGINGAMRVYRERQAKTA